MKLFRVTLVVAAIVVGACLYIWPALVPEARIRESLLVKTPLGSNLNSVLSIPTKEHWNEPLVESSSYMVFPAGSSGTLVTAYTALMRYDPFPFSSRIVVTCQFDQSQKLQNILVHRIKSQ